MSSSWEKTAESPAQLVDGWTCLDLSPHPAPLGMGTPPVEYDDGALAGGDGFPPTKELCCMHLFSRGGCPFNLASHRPQPTFSNRTSPFVPPPSPPFPRPSSAPTTSLLAFAAGILENPGTDVVR